MLNEEKAAANWEATETLQDANFPSFINNMIDSLSLKLLLLLWIIESSISHAVTKACNYMVYLTSDAGH